MLVTVKPTMDHEYQPPVPESFLALFASPGRLKPSQAIDAIRERYGYCEDLACLLVETARSRQLQLGIQPSDVLERISAGLRGGDVVANEQEARWVMTRLAELLHWQP